MLNIPYQFFYFVTKMGKKNDYEYNKKIKCKMFMKLKNLENPIKKLGVRNCTIYWLFLYEYVRWRTI